MKYTDGDQEDLEDEDEEGNTSCRVSYVLDKRIALNRITVTMIPYKDTTSSNRNRREPIRCISSKYLAGQISCHA